MNRDRLLRRLEEDWQSFLATFAGLSDAVLHEPGVVGEWSIRDLMAHVTTWEEEALKALPSILEGGSTVRYAQYGGIDAFNAAALERKRHMSLAEVRRALASTHTRLVDFVSGVPESAYAKEGRFLRRLRLDTYRHYRQHARQIEAWLKGRQR
jgi:hypothetical protein